MGLRPQVTEVTKKVRSERSIMAQRLKAASSRNPYRTAEKPCASTVAPAFILRRLQFGRRDVDHNGGQIFSEGGHGCNPILFSTRICSGEVLIERRSQPPQARQRRHVSLIQGIGLRLALFG